MPRVDTEFPDRLRRLVDESGKTQSEVADELGVSTATIWTWLTGKSAPRSSSLKKLASYFEVPVAWMVHGGPSPGAQLGDRVLHRMREIGIADEAEIERAAGLDSGTLALMVRTGGSPGRRTVEALAAALKCDPDWLLHGAGQRIVDANGVRVTTSPKPTEDELLGEDFYHRKEMAHLRSKLKELEETTGISTRAQLIWLARVHQELGRLLEYTEGHHIQDLPSESASPRRPTTRRRYRRPPITPLPVHQLTEVEAPRAAGGRERRRWSSSA